jgi:hypothetical protein
VQDLLYIGLTIVVFAALWLLVKGVERRSGPRCARRWARSSRGYGSASQCYANCSARSAWTRYASIHSPPRWPAPRSGSRTRWHKPVADCRVAR